MEKSELIEFLKENLKLNVETSSEYTGGMDGESLYKESHVVRLELCNEVISEAYIN